MRGRGRKGPNPLSRTYESNGPDVKIRGTAQHVAEKYQQLARDAQASGDRVMSENYLQHAEHYLRIIAAAQPQTVQQNARSEHEDGSELHQGSGSAPSQMGEQPPLDQPDVSVVDEDSPQPFIESMPTIDAAGQVNGNGGRGEAGTGDADDEKPKRRVRTPRARAPKRVASDLSGTDPDSDALAAAGEGEGGAGGVEADAAEKPRARRAARTRQTKKPAEAVDAEVVAAGE
ncbi:hypothetical protein GCM10011316_36690 [Roseibium aquae]|uniref:DUF4167 domain-containing protein n=2 Tax=Roseibium aquae TaxID=1323746 RepID=A0A916TQB8_9HYPH|nr:hypothetical protein GCM10011316_36690 [Roseibium aquae]